MPRFPVAAIIVEEAPFQQSASISLRLTRQNLGWRRHRKPQRQVAIQLSVIVSFPAWDLWPGESRIKV